MTSMCFYPDGTHLVSVGDDKNLVIWDLSNGNMISCDSNHDSFLSCVSMCKTVPALVTGSADKTLKIWFC